MVESPLLYSQAALPDVQYEQDFMKQLEASKQLNTPTYVRKSAVKQSPIASLPVNDDVRIFPATDLSNLSDLLPGKHNVTTIYFIFNSEIVELTGNEVVRLCQMSDKFSIDVLMGLCSEMMFLPKIKVISSKLITGSAFKAMCSIALFNTVFDDNMSAPVYWRAFREGQNAWLAAILHSNEVFGPFPNVHEWVQAHRTNKNEACENEIKASPMPHEFKMQMPYVDFDVHVRDKSFDTSNRYTFEHIPNTAMNQSTFVERVRDGWTYLGPRVYSLVKQGASGYDYVFRRPLTEREERA